MPLYSNGLALVRRNLEMIARGERAPLVAIGCLTDKQMADLNETRRKRGIHEVTDPEVLYIGRHHYNSRSEDNYNIDEMVLQVESVFTDSVVIGMGKSMGTLQSTQGRRNSAGLLIKDLGTLEATARKPKVELFSVIPKGDGINHEAQKRKRPT